MNVPSHLRPRVSVVVAFLDAARFLDEAVESVAGQRFPDWELLLVDDGSTDGSSELAREHARRDPARVRYLEHPGHRNRGATVSRNLGVAHARGEYLAILDADDVWLPEKLHCQVEILDAHPEAVMTFGDPLYWRSWTHAPEDADADVRRGIWTRTGAAIGPPEMLRLSYPLGPGGSPCPSDLLLRLKCVRRIGGFEEEFVGMYQLFEDIAFLAKIYLDGAVVVSDQCWTRYRIHPDSCVSRYRRGAQYDRVRHFYLRWLKRYLRSQGMQDPEIREALKRALRKHDPPVVRWARKQVRRAARLMLLPSS